MPCIKHAANAVVSIMPMVMVLFALFIQALPQTRAMPLSSALDTLAGKCWRRKVGGYTYEWCHEQHVLQIHTAPTLLGKFQRWRSQEMHTHIFGGGEACAGAAGGRQAQVRFKCCSGKNKRKSGDDVAIHSVEEPRPCFYQLEVCVPKLCPEGGGSRGEGTQLKHGTKGKRKGKHNTKGQRKRKRTSTRGAVATPMPPMPAATRKRLREEVRAMFTFAYDSYMRHAFPAPELAPVSCRGKGFDLSALPMVTLIDSLDTLAIMGNGSEFRRAVRLIESHSHALPEKEEMRHDNGADNGQGIVRDANVLSHGSHRLWRTSTPRHHVGGVQNSTKRLKWARDWAFETRRAELIATAPSAKTAPHLARSKVRAPPAWPALFDVDRNVSLFETNIRVLGGLLSGHLLAEDAGLGLFDAQGAQPYTGSLLRLAHDLGARLLPAFRTSTGIPFGTINLRKGVPPNETTVASLAGAGTLSLEFGMLSILTGDKQFGSVAHRAVRALFARRDADTGLLGKHIDTATGQWVEATAGIGNGADSFYEYLLKSHVLFGDTSDRSGSLRMFEHAYSNVSRWLRIGDWFGEANIGDGSPARLKFEGLQAFWPGLMVLAGDVRAAAASLNAFYAVWRRWNGLPEQVSFPTLEFENGENRDGARSYPLRPELIESTWMLHRATGDDSWLWAGKDVLETLQRRSRVDCGFSIVADVASGLDRDDKNGQQKQHVAEGPSDSMPSFFLSETLKYLYLLFEDDDHFLHQKPGGSGIAKQNTTASLPHQYRLSHHRAGWVMTTEAHPLPLLPDADMSWQTEKDSLLFPYSAAEKEAVERRAPSQCVATRGMRLPPQHRPYPYGVDANTCAALDPEAQTQNSAVRRREVAERDSRQEIRAQRKARQDLLEALQNTSTSTDDWPDFLEEEIALDRAEQEEEDDEEEDEEEHNSDFLSVTSWDFTKHQVSRAWSWSRWRSWRKGQGGALYSFSPNQRQQLVGYNAYATTPWPLGYRRLYTVALSQADNAVLQRRVQLRQQQVAAAQESMKQHHFQLSMASLQQQISSQLQIGNLFAGFSGSSAGAGGSSGGSSGSSGGGMAQQLLSQVASQLQRAMGLGRPAQPSSQQGNNRLQLGNQDNDDDDSDDDDAVNSASQSPVVQSAPQQTEQVQMVRSDDIGSDGSSGRFEVLNFDGGFRIIRMHPDSVPTSSKGAAKGVAMLSGAGQTVEVSGMASHAALVQRYDAEDVGIDIDVDTSDATSGTHAAASDSATRNIEYQFKRRKRPPFVSLFQWLSAAADPDTDGYSKGLNSGWNGGRCLMDMSRACFVAIPPTKVHRKHHEEKLAAAAASRRYAKNDRVRVNWKGLGRYYGGKIHLTGTSNTYTILYDDGDVEADVPLSRILPPPEIQANEQRIWHTVLECNVQVFEGEDGDVTEGSPEHRFACAPGLFGPFIESARDAAINKNTPHFEYDSCFFAEGACPTRRKGSLRTTGSSSGRLIASSPLRACSTVQLKVDVHGDDTKQVVRDGAHAPIVLAVRGGCSFEAKARAAQQAGAAALIVVDNEHAPLMAMAGEEVEDGPERNGAGVLKVNIPVALVTADTGSALLHLARMPNGARARLSLRRPGSLDPGPADGDDAENRAGPPPVEAHDAGMMVRASGNWTVQSIAVAMAIPGQAQPMTTVTLALRAQNASGW